MAVTGGHDVELHQPLYQRRTGALSWNYNGFVTPWIPRLQLFLAEDDEHRESGDDDEN